MSDILVSRMRVLQPLGRISFSLYLIHLPLLCRLMSWSYTALLPHHSTGEILAWEAAFVALSLASATVMTWMVDEPVLRLVSGLKRISTFSARTSSTEAGT